MLFSHILQSKQQYIESTLFFHGFVIATIPFRVSLDILMSLIVRLMLTLLCFGV